MSEIIDVRARELHPPRTAAAPRDVLNQRYARGELTTEEYTERLQTLTENTGR